MNNINISHLRPCEDIFGISSSVLLTYIFESHKYYFSHVTNEDIYKPAHLQHSLILCDIIFTKNFCAVGFECCHFCSSRWNRPPEKILNLWYHWITCWCDIGCLRLSSMLRKYGAHMQEINLWGPWHHHSHSNIYHLRETVVQLWRLCLHYHPIGLMSWK